MQAKLRPSRGIIVVLALCCWWWWCSHCNLWHYCTLKNVKYSGDGKVVSQGKVHPYTVTKKLTQHFLLRDVFYNTNWYKWHSFKYQVNSYFGITEELILHMKHASKVSGKHVLQTKEYFHTHVFTHMQISIHELISSKLVLLFYWGIIPLVIFEWLWLSIIMEISGLFIPCVQILHVI